MAKFQPVKHPGAATRKAEAEGVSLSKWEQEHKNDAGQTGKQARFPLIAKKWNHKGSKKKTPKGNYDYKRHWSQTKTARKKG